MALDRIEQAVEERVRQEAAHILEKAQEEADVVAQKQIEEARYEAEQWLRREMRTIEEDFARKLNQFRGEASKQLLNERNARLDEVFARAREALLAKRPDAYRQLMARLLGEAADSMAATVRMHPEDQAMFAGIVRELNGTRTAAQEIVIDNERPLETRGGFILEGSDYDVDQTLDTLFQDLRHDLAAEIAADLFQNDAGSSTS